MLAAGLNSGIYKFLLLLHILTVIVGIGAVVLNGVYAAEAQKRPGPAGRGVSEANYAVTAIAEKVIYLIPIFGILLVLVSDDAWEFDQTWIWLSLLVYIAAIGVADAVLTPGHRRINELLVEMENAPPPAGGPPPQVAEIEATGQRLAMAGMFNNLAVVVLVALMIWKPGV